jgi:hypothetical protein
VPEPSPADWQQIGRVMLDLYLCVALGVNAALAVLLGFGVVPSLASTVEVPAGVLRLRRWLLPVAGLSVVLMLVALARGLTQAVVTVQQLFPRFGL